MTKRKNAPKSVKILITAGPTWIKIDQVRILTTIFTGKTGLFIARELKKRGCNITLLLNPHAIEGVKGLRVITFRYFAEFKNRIMRELKHSDYDVIIHSAAVSDYGLKQTMYGKIPSGRKQILLRLTPMEKIVKLIRRKAPKSLLVQFKLEMKRKGLLKKAYESLRENKSDFVVANAMEDLQRGYKAFLINKTDTITEITSRMQLVDVLFRIALRRA